MDKFSLCSPVSIWPGRISEHHSGLGFQYLEVFSWKDGWARILHEKTKAEKPTTSIVGFRKLIDCAQKNRCSLPATQPSGFARRIWTTTLRNWARNHEQILPERIANQK
jgi:hypothetical protein